MKNEHHKDEKKVVYGICKNRIQVESVLERLKREGFRHSDISVLMADQVSTKEFAHEKSTKAPEGATVGAVTGIAAGGILGWLVGIGSLAIPGIGAFVAAGPIMGALAGVGVGGTLGGLTGGLIGMGLPEYEAKRYAGFVKDGGILISVHADDSDWVKKAKRTLEAENVSDISSTSEASMNAQSSSAVSRSMRP